MGHATPFLKVVDRDEATRRFHAALSLTPLGIEEASLDECLGRTLADDVIAQVNVPSFDRSNFDGFAVRAEDLEGASETTPVRLLLSSTKIDTGKAPLEELQSRVAMSIATGGMLPRGANAVVLIEDCLIEGKRVAITRSVPAGHGISTTGGDIAHGETVLYANSRLTSRETGVLAALGCQTVSVWRRPVIAVISTGNEIIHPGATMRPGLVYDSNARMISDSIRELGAEAIELGIAVDRFDELEKAVETGLSQADFVILSGGTSKGQGDLCYQVVSKWSDPGIIVHGVSLKPGKPVCLAATRGKPVVVLPGFPSSAIFTFHEFVAPVITKLSGNAERIAGTIEATLAHRVRSEIGRTEYLLVGLVPSDPSDDSELARPTAFPMGKGSGSVTTFARADGFIKLERDLELLDADQVVNVRLLSEDLRPADLVVIGSQCSGLDWLMSTMRARGHQVRFFAVGSEAGLKAVRDQRCDVAGIHLYDVEKQAYNAPFVDPKQMTLIQGYRRRQGIVFRKSDQSSFGETIEQASSHIMRSQDCRMINRNLGSGTRILIDQFLDGSRPLGYDHYVSQHAAVVAAIAQGRADWGIAIREVIDQELQGFIPITDEHFDFVVHHSRQNRPAVKAFIDLIGEPGSQHALSEMGFGLDADEHR